MKKIIFLLLLSAVVFTTNAYSQSIKDKAEIVGVENEYVTETEYNYLSIKVRNPFNYNVIAVVELKENYSDDRDHVILKKYIVLGPREEYTIRTKVTVTSITNDFAYYYDATGSGKRYYYTNILAYKASAFQQ